MVEKLEKEPVRESTKQARMGALEALLALKNQLVALKPEEVIRLTAIDTAQRAPQNTNYCCAGCSPGYGRATTK